MPTGPQGDHLFFILTDKCKDGRHCLANVTSVPKTGFYDQTCIISAGEHDFITHDSYVLYRRSILEDADRLSKMVGGWLYKPHKDASDELIDKILDGASKSEHTPNFVVNYLGGL